MSEDELKESKFEDFLTKCDLFYSNINFRVGGEDEFKSLLGGVVTIFFACFCVGYLIFYGIDFITKENISLIDFTKKVKDTPLIDFRNSDFMFSFAIAYENFDNKKNLIAVNDFDNYLDYSINLTSIGGNTNKNSIRIRPKPCAKDDFHNLVDMEFELNEIQNFYCPSIIPEDNFTLEGTPTDDYFKYLEIEIKLKPEAKTNMDLLKEKMKQNPLKIIFYYLDKGVDFENYKEPLSTVMGSFETSLDFYFMKKVEMYFSNLEFTKDNGWVISLGKSIVEPLFEEVEEKFRFFPDRDDSDFFVDDSDKDKDVMAKITLMASRKNLRVVRKYEKLTSFAGDTVDVLEEIGILLIVFVGIFEKKALEREIISKIFKFKGSRNYNLDYLLQLFNKGKYKAGKKVKFGQNVSGNTSSKNIKIVNSQNHLSNKSLKIYQKSSNNNPINFVTNRTNSINVKNPPKKGNKIDNFEGKDSFQKTSLMSFKNHSSNKDTNQKILNNINRSSTNQKGMMIKKKKSNNGVSIFNSNSNNFSKKRKSIGTKKTNTNNIKGDEYFLDYERIGLFTMTFYFCCNNYSKERNQRYKIIDRALKEVANYLDVFRYIKGMQQIEIMKTCFFDRDKRNLLDFISKPSFRMSIGGNESLYEVDVKTPPVIKNYNKEDIDILYDSYLRTKRIKNKAMETKKLLRLMDNEIDFFK